MIPTPDNPLRVVGISVVADIEATSIFDPEAGHDTAHITTTLVLADPDPELTIPVTGGGGALTHVELTGSQVVRLQVRRPVPRENGLFKLTLAVPDPADIIELVEGSPVSVLVLLPAPVPPAVRPQLVDWTKDKNAVVYGTDAVDSEQRAGVDEREALATRTCVSWQFDRDPDLATIWRYLTGR